jgi:Uma2 family endonuclease
MPAKLSVDEYLAGPEQLDPIELVWGVVREPAAPRIGHQEVVGTTFSLLREYVLTNQLGRVLISPADVVLDKERALVVQPDVFFVSNARVGIIQDVVWSAPDLVVEVGSLGTARRDRTTKLGWYRRYGVFECWLVNPFAQAVVVVDLQRRGRSAFRRFSGDQPVNSRVLPRFEQPARAFFD